ncbi:MAG: class I SAM-dependent methyltransferase [Candidatus Thiodiazotropha sp. (ex Lucinoma kastoroae)]|nr:class I SAM-dependent methyltransferase [Candidatus Thiodiazotropha sp. (ex Lucinoma kastoroae)]MCU7862245.1 class I SAM-dependent methyltransferase [Candidatus Thiodiazotropha sp. (ex Lucinoma kastoroae)]
MTTDTPDIEFEKSPCPMGCHASDELIVIGQDRINHLPGEFHVVKCQQCGLMRTDPRPTSDSMGFYYPDDYGPYLGTQASANNTRSAALKRWLRTILDVRSEYIPKIAPGKLLEIGCASGAYLQKMEGMGWQVTGIEFSPHAAEAARELGYPVYAGSLESATLESTDFDLITGWMVLEHLHDPVAGLHKLYEWVRPGGWLAFSVPNAASLEFKLLKERWYALHLPNHLYHYTPDTIRAMLTHTGWTTPTIYHQRTLSSLLASMGHFLDDKGYHHISRWVVGKPQDPVRLYQVLYPLAMLAATMGQTGRMTVWARKPG